MIRFKCPHCGKEISAGDEHAGKKGRCPGCKELFQIPVVRAAKPAPAAERRTPPPPADEDDEDEAPPRRKPARDEEDDEDEAPRKKKRARDEDDDEAVAEAPRKRRPARDEDDEDEDDRPRRKRARDEEDDEDDEPRPRRKRGRDEDEDDEDDRPRRKKKRRKGPYADCPNCGCRGDATRIYYSFGWGFLPMFFSTVRCNRCGTEYNGKHGDYNLKRYLIYMAIVIPIALILGIIGAILESK